MALFSMNCDPTFKNHSATNLYDLNGKIQYAKVINELEIDSYADDIFEEIIGITCNMLPGSKKFKLCF
jgi:hypothetical protein